MTSSTGSGCLLGEGAAREAESVVECDRGGQREEAAREAGSEAVEGAGTAR
jgi:hypothetical protein